MPEGHSIHRATRRLRSVLEGRPLERVEARGPDLKVARAEQRLLGATVTELDCHGKNLFIHLDNGMSIYSHLKMDGAWHLYRDGERWRRPRRFAWLVLGHGEWDAVNFGGPVLELLPTDALRRDRRFTELGPDLLKDPFDDAEYLRRMRRNDRREIGDAVMQQRIVAGIGNIYKNESLFMSGIDPWRRVSSLSDDELVDLRVLATQIMTEGILDPRTITFHGPGPAGNWVYGRTDQACRRCAGPLQVALQGEDQRITWWCEHCQT